MVKSPAADARWQKQIDRRLKVLDDTVLWLKKTFPPDRKRRWDDIVSLERANHYLELAALQIARLRESKPPVAARADDAPRR